MLLGLDLHDEYMCVVSSTFSVADSVVRWYLMMFSGQLASPGHTLAGVSALPPE